MVRMNYERREEGFLELGSYFDGSNNEGIELNETQPIIMRHDQRRVRHALPVKLLCTPVKTPTSANAGIAYMVWLSIVLYHLQEAGLSGSPQSAEFQRAEWCNLLCRVPKRCSSSLGRRGMAHLCKCVAADVKCIFALSESASLSCHMLC